MAIGFSTSVINGNDHSFDTAKQRFSEKAAAQNFQRFKLAVTDFPNSKFPWKILSFKINFEKFLLFICKTTHTV